jgi:transposase
VSKKIENPAECEVRAVIRFLNAQNVCRIGIYCQLIAVYGKGVMNESNVRKWCQMFNEGRTNVHDEERSGRPSLITEDFKNKIDQHITSNKRFTLDEIYEKFSESSCSLIHEIVMEHLHYKEIYAGWVSRMLTTLHYITFPGSIVSQNDCRMWNKSYKYNNTYTVHLKHSKNTYTHTYKLILSTYTMYTNL